MENQMEPNSHCVEAYYEDSGALQPSSDNDTADLFRDLEHELEELVQRYHVPPNDLEKLFQVSRAGVLAGLKFRLPLSSAKEDSSHRRRAWLQLGVFLPDPICHVINTAMQYWRKKFTDSLQM